MTHVKFLKKGIDAGTTNLGGPANSNSVTGDFGAVGGGVGNTTERNVSDAWMCFVRRIRSCVLENRMMFAGFLSAGAGCDILDS